MVRVTPKPRRRLSVDRATRSVQALVEAPELSPCEKRWRSVPRLPVIRVPLQQGREDELGGGLVGVRCSQAQQFDGARA